ncbi:MAG TPA: NlpC/P60 family protein [Terriglobales bacterium]|nr:NlpC/P60 family protein [Terriglobales bacterium]
MEILATSRVAVGIMTVALLGQALPGWGSHRHHKRPAKPPAREGMAIIAAALNFSHTHRTRPDCSHLVHDVYVDAGLAYPYVDSLDLYRGAPGFRSVKNPQPGDLVVWRTHSGIVVDPDQRSFYSSLNSGLGVDYYDSHYWKHKGKARFYRFVGIREEQSASTDEPSD